MLNQIHIRDFATIEELQLHLQTGTTMISGETGSGKSIFIEAIEIALGGRASQNIVRPGKDKSEISLVFDVTHFPHVISCLKSVDLYTDTTDCIIRRIITSDGRSRAYVNGTPVTLQFVKELGELLFHLHGQHEQQVLLKAEKQREMLDRYGDLLSIAIDVKKIAEQWKAIDEEIFQLKQKSHERAERFDYLRFQLDEILALKIMRGEWEQLEKEHFRLTHADELIQTINQILHQLSEADDQPILRSLYLLRKNIESMLHVEPQTHTWLTSLNSAIISLEELGSDLKNHLEKTDLDPETLKNIEERFSAFFNLARKHKIEPNVLYDYQEHLMQELKSLESSDERITELLQKQKILSENYIAKSQILTEGRKKAASKLQTEITQTIRSLSLPYGEFQIAFEKENHVMSVHGNEKIIFLIKFNPDQALQPLHKVISGGELSRLSLATHLALANRTNIPTLVFDEVDTGLSGATAEKIGKLLRKLGESYQVFCVTHQSQVAANGHQHLLVEKYFLEQNTYSRLRLLNETERTKEIARMLGGEKITEKTLAHAKEVLQSVN